MQDICYLIYCNCPDQQSASTIANQLIKEKLAACVNILPTIHSIYEWEGKLENQSETQLLIKSTASKYSNLDHTIKQLHPYECPEIIAIEIKTGNEEYLRWVTEATK